MTESQARVKKIKIYLSDPQVLFREGIHFILSGEEDFEVTGESTNNEDAYAHIETNPPNIAVLNVRDEKLDGLEITRRIKRKFPTIATILTVDKKAAEEILEIMKSGVSACLLKDTEPEQLIETIRIVAQGGLPITEELLNPELAHRVLADFEDTDALNKHMDNLMASLTQKEAQIIGVIATGSNAEQTAAKLGIDEDAVLYNLRLILNKLVANDRIRAIIETVQQGIPSILSAASRTKLSEDYLTREEFNQFKENLAKRLKNIVGEVV